MNEFIISRFRSYARALLLIAILVTPLVVDFGSLDNFALGKITLLYMCSLFGVGLLLVWCYESRTRIPSSPILRLAVVFLLAISIATVFSQNPKLSLVGLYQRYGGLVPLLIFAGLMLTLVGCYWDKPDDLRKVATAAGAASLVVGAYVLIQAAGLDVYDWHEQTGGTPTFPISTIGNSNFSGGYLGITAPFVLYLALSAKTRRRKSLLSAAFCALLLALWYTGARNGLAGGLAGMVVIAWAYRESLHRIIRLVLVAGLSAVVLIGVLVIWHPGMTSAPFELERVKVLEVKTLRDRAWYWGTAIKIFADHPIVGTGPETYYANYPHYRYREDGATLGMVTADKPHNVVLEYASNAGILGLSAYLALMLTALVSGYRRSRRLEGPRRLLLVTFVASLAGYLAQSVFSIDIPLLAFMGWLCLGAIAVLCMNGEPRLAREGTEGARKPVQSMIVRGGACVVLACLVAVGIRPLRADVKFRMGEFDRAIRLYSLESAYKGRAGKETAIKAVRQIEPAEQIRLLKKAETYYLDAIETKPYDSNWLIGLARVRTVYAELVDPNRFDEARRAWNAVVNNDPTNKELAKLAKDDFRRSSEGAKERLKAAARVRPNYASAWVALGEVYAALNEQEEARAAVGHAISLAPTNERALGLMRKLAE